MIGQATQTEWGQESTIANMRAQLGQWRTSIIGTARLGAEEAMTNLLLNRTQYQIANNLMVANGYGQYANMMQGLDASYLPWSDMIATLLGAEMNLQSWQFGWQGGNIMTNYAGVDVLTSATSQAQAGLSAM
jgi:hypothetical protein